MIRRLILVAIGVFFAMATLIASPASVNAAGFLDRFQGVQQSNQKLQEDQSSKQEEYLQQSQYAQDKQADQMQQAAQGKDGQYSYSNNQANQPDSQNAGQSAQVKSESAATPD
ncbi:MAG: hypothetical protein KME15_14400 [Drouetiella hepatica Uher 2000/2452]|jgi:hypothetical protein|uniref:Uncharacterized protein n=1 Tax=Drouetiella hepatica Uher 2000/2452 TaxID=904376 RepID=A0A951QBQ6_9CYAN|nr:hypothetical protein [Drouetiella hepatica Uher 2000/2452]